MAATRLDVPPAAAVAGSSPSQDGGGGAEAAHSVFWAEFERRRRADRLQRQARGSEVRKILEEVQQERHKITEEFGTVPSAAVATVGIRNPSPKKASEVQQILAEVQRERQGATAVCEGAAAMCQGAAATCPAGAAVRPLATTAATAAAVAVGAARTPSPKRPAPRRDANNGADSSLVAAATASPAPSPIATVAAVPSPDSETSNTEEGRRRTAVFVDDDLWGKDEDEVAATGAGGPGKTSSSPSQATKSNSQCEESLEFPPRPGAGGLVPQTSAGSVVVSGVLAASTPTLSPPAKTRLLHVQGGSTQASPPRRRGKPKSQSPPPLQRTSSPRLKRVHQLPRKSFDCAEAQQALRWASSLRRLPSARASSGWCGENEDEESSAPPKAYPAGGWDDRTSCPKSFNGFRDGGRQGGPSGWKALWNPGPGEVGTEQLAAAGHPWAWDGRTSCPKNFGGFIDHLGSSRPTARKSHSKQGSLVAEGWRALEMTPASLGGG